MSVGMRWEDIGKKQNSDEKYAETINEIREKINDADAVFIGAGAGMSTAAGYIYTGENFEKYFGDFSRKYGFKDMYSGGFYSFQTREEFWAYWSRYIYINRYTKVPGTIYQDLLKLIKDKDYFVLTTNVDHCFQKTGFDKKRLFYTQGDYGLWQCSKPCHEKTYENEEVVKQMVLSQGFEISKDGMLVIPDDITLKMEVPTDLIPRCPVCGEEMSMNLRADGTFVEDDGWHKAAERYSEFTRRHQNLKTVFLEIGVGFNTPGIIKYPFWNMTAHNEDATYICLNYNDAGCPREIKNQSICLEGDAQKIVSDILAKE